MTAARRMKSPDRENLPHKTQCGYTLSNQLTLQHHHRRGSRGVLHPGTRPGSDPRKGLGGEAEKGLVYIPPNTITGMTRRVVCSCLRIEL